MVKVLHCNDAGFACDAVVRADTTEELLAQVRPHALEVHGVTVDDALEQRLVPLVREQEAPGQD